MPDENDQDKAETVTETPLHAYKDGREGDVEKLKAGDPETSQRKEIENDGEETADHIEAPEKH